MLAHARVLDVTDVVKFVDSVSQHDLIALYQRAMVTVVPSLIEGFSKPALESMACGTPVIGTAVGAIPELVDKSSGVLVAPGDAGVLAAALIDLLQDDRRVKRMGVAARRRAVTLFAWDNVAQRVLSVCEGAPYLEATSLYISSSFWTWTFKSKVLADVRAFLLISLRRVESDESICRSEVRASTSPGGNRKPLYPSSMSSELRLSGFL